MIYRVKKQVFNSKGYSIETSYFDVPCAFVDEVIRLLVSEGYTVFENDDYYKMLSALKDNHTYSRYSFRKVSNG